MNPQNIAKLFSLSILSRLHQEFTRKRSKLMLRNINRLFAYCEGGNFNIYGRGLAISSAKQGESGFIYNLLKNKCLVWAAQTCVHPMKTLTVNTLNSHLSTLEAHNHKMYGFFWPHLKYLKTHRQTGWTQIRLLL